MSALRAALVLACVLACHREPTQAPAALDGELRGLCERVQARTISAWSQPVYFSPELGPLTRRVDAGEPAARCELGALMQKHRVRACRTIARGLRDSCA